MVPLDFFQRSVLLTTKGKTRTVQILKHYFWCMGVCFLLSLFVWESSNGDDDYFMHYVSCQGNHSLVVAASMNDISCHLCVYKSEPQIGVQQHIAGDWNLC